MHGVSLEKSDSEIRGCIKFDSETSVCVKFHPETDQWVKFDSERVMHEVSP
jgi:hypothetical protein